MTIESLTLWLFFVGTIVALILTFNAVVILLRVKVPYVRTPAWVVRWLKEHVRLQPGQTFVELGCGDAQVLAALAKQFPQARFIGYELSWWPFALARFRTKRLKNIEIRREDFYQADFTGVSGLFCYLLNTIMPKLKAVVGPQLQPGTMLYSYAFSFPDWTPEQALVKPGKQVGTRLWVYRRA